MKKFQTMIAQAKKQNFTLLELLLVVFILSSVALATLFTVEFADEQSRFEETKSRIAQIERAIVGDPFQSSGGHPVISGYVADMGKLPECLALLLQQDAFCDPDEPEFNQPDWGFNADAGIWNGWRGPYLAAFADIGTNSPVFRDGWGTRATSDPTNLNPENFGWFYQLQNNAMEIQLQSVGRDGRVDTGGETDYDVDYPAGNDNLITVDDHRIPINTTYRVRFRNATDAATSPAKFRLGFVFGDALEQPWPAGLERNTTSYLADTAAIIPALPNKGDISPFILIDFGKNVAKSIPWGRRAIVAYKESGNEGNPEILANITYRNNIHDYLPRGLPPLLTDSALIWDIVP